MDEHGAGKNTKRVLKAGCYKFKNVPHLSLYSVLCLRIEKPHVPAISLDVSGSCGLKHRVHVQRRTLPRPTMVTADGVAVD